MDAGGPSVFGTRARTKVLIALALLDQTYPRELARVTDLSLMTVQRIVNKLEREGTLSSRRVGVQREVRLNPRGLAVNELRSFLLRLAEADREIMTAVGQLRRRPRRAGKEL